MKQQTNRSRTRLKRVRYAVIGQGYISQIAVLPAFKHAQRNSVLQALVSDDPKKLKTLGRRYGVEQLYRYDELDELFSSGSIDAVYIALPNSMHEEYTVRAARAGLHVLCEKPMAVTAAECERMMEAVRENGVKLMIAYRLHFERANLEAVEIARSGRLGDVRYFTSEFSMHVAEGNIRLQRELGGGPLYDIGLYCINAARAAFAAEPKEVWATQVNRGESKLKEVPETVSAVMRFPGERLASFTCSFNATDRSTYTLVGKKGSLTVDPAYEHAVGLRYELRIGEKVRRRKFAKSDQFAPELQYFSNCVLRNRAPEPSGAEGLADVRIVEALHRSIRTGKFVSIDEPRERLRRPTLKQELRHPPASKPQLIHVTPP